MRGKRVLEYDLCGATIRFSWISRDPRVISKRGNSVFPVCVQNFSYLIRKIQLKIFPGRNVGVFPEPCSYDIQVKKAQLDKHVVSRFELHMLSVTCIVETVQIRRVNCLFVSLVLFSIVSIARC